MERERGDLVEPAPQVTVSLVTYNGLRWLAGCFSSLRAQHLSNFELLVLDNASSDGTASWLREEARHERRMSLFESATNVGYAAGHNRHIFSARAPLILLLNQDVELDDGFLEHAVAALTGRSSVAAIQGRIMRLGQAGERLAVFDSTGLEMRRDRRVVARNQGERQASGARQAGDVWGADGPAPLYRRAALLAIAEPRSGGGREVLDEDFFMYKEDVDLAWRLRRAGWKAWYEPNALAWHARGAGGGPPRSVVDVIRSDRELPGWIKRVSWRNHRLMQIKNEDVGDYVRSLPWIIRREFLSLGFMALVDPRRLAVIADLARAAPAALRKRRAIRRIFDPAVSGPAGRGSPGSSGP